MVTVYVWAIPCIHTYTYQQRRLIMNDKQRKRGHSLVEITKRTGKDADGNKTSDSLRMCLLTKSKDKLRDRNFTRGYTEVLLEFLTNKRDQELDDQQAIDEVNTIRQVAGWDSSSSVEWDDDL
jgi:hypothetical protein